MPQNAPTLDFSDSLVPNQAPADFSDALVPTASPGAQPIRTAALKPGESIYRRYSTIDPEKTKQVLASQLPPVGAAIGELGGPLGAAAGAAAGTQAERFLGQKPTVAETGENALFYGGTSGIMKGVGKLGEWLGLFGPKTAPEMWSAANEALGVPKSEISLPMGAKGPEAAFIDPGRAVVERAGIAPNDLAKMSPFEQAQRIAPAWHSAGSEVSAIADTATKSGTTFDAGKSLFKAMGTMPPDVEAYAEKFIKRQMDGLGIVDLRKATPEEGRQLLQALYGASKNYQNVPVRDVLYNAVRNDLTTAVPQLDHALKSYAGLTRAMEATQEAQAAGMVKRAPSAAATAWKGLPRPVQQGVVQGGALVLGAGGMKKLSDMAGF
jgi:hypothetical protein